MGTLFLSIFALIFAAELMSLFGTEYVESAFILRILILGQLVNAFAGIVTLLFSMTGAHGYYVRVMLVTCLLNICFLPIGYHFAGVGGIAVVTTMTIVVWNAWLVYGSLTKLKINPVFTFGPLRF